MASRAGPLIAATLALGVATLTLGPALALLSFGWSPLRAADLSALRFTLTQAALSALISAALAVPLSRALARRRFTGRGLVLTLLGAPFLLPVVVAVLGLVTVFGRSGWVNAALTALHLPPLPIYGLQGVVLAHVFLNLPLATRMLLTGWHSIPAERFRLAETLGLPPRALFRHLERPMLRAELPAVLVTVFLICLTSFAVALTLGGGPKATTLELGIYQALRYDFDLPRAGQLALLQMALCALGVALAWRFTRTAGLGAGLGRQAAIPAPQGWRLWADGAGIALAILFLMLPLLAVLVDGLPGLPHLAAPIWRAAGLSLMMALASASLCTLAALTLALTAAAHPRLAPALDLAAMLPLVASGLVMGTGLFALLRPYAQPDQLAVPVTVLTNAALALPFGFRLLLPPAQRTEADFARLATALGLQGSARLRWVTLPRLARPLGLTAGLSAALAMGDLGVIALFASEGSATLPLMIQRLSGAYQMDQAAAAAVLLSLISFALYATCDAIGRRHALP